MEEVIFEEGDTVYFKYTDKPMVVANVDERFVTCIIQIRDKLLYPIFERRVLSKTPFTPTEWENNVLGIDFSIASLAKAIGAKELSIDEWNAIGYIYSNQSVTPEMRIKEIEEAIAFLSRHADSLRKA